MIYPLFFAVKLLSLRGWSLWPCRGWVRQALTEATEFAPHVGLQPRGTLSNVLKLRRSNPFAWCACSRVLWKFNPWAAPYAPELPHSWLKPKLSVSVLKWYTYNTRSPLPKSAEPSSRRLEMMRRTKPRLSPET